VRDVNDPRHREGEGHQQHAGGQDLGAEQQAHPVDPVGEHAAPELEHHERHALGQPEIAEVESVVADLPHHPRERQVLGAVAQDVEDEAEPVEPIVPVSKG
jgi:hypothetical protein